MLCKARSLMRKMGKYVLVGDNVTIINIDWRDNRGLVAEVQPRSSEIMNPKMANVDHFALVFALADPPPEAFQVSLSLACQFLVSVHAGHVWAGGVSCSCSLQAACARRVAVRGATASSVWGHCTRLSLSSDNVTQACSPCTRCSPMNREPWTQAQSTASL